MRKLRKSSDQVIWGVCGGIAEWLEVDPTIIRALWLFAALFAGTGIFLYCILALLMPDR